jgi:hypothetical protein
MTTLEEKKKNRWLMLRKFYEKANGQSDYNIINMWEVGKDLGWDRETTNATFDYLQGERLLKAMTLGGGAAITHEGVKEVEQAEEYPEKPTLHFPPLIVYVGDTYTIGQAGAVGPHAHAHDMTFSQIWTELQPSIDLSKLAEELSRLRQEMRKDAIEPEHDIAISEIAKAEQAAKAGNGSKAVAHLKTAGKWALDVATKVGTSLAMEAIKKSVES